MGRNKPIKGNKLNDLTGTDWLKFQKSWFIHNPPPREQDVLVHPAKFPEAMIQEFIEFFTKPGQLVLDPMCGTGSALIAAMRAGRNSVGIELSPRYAEIAEQRIETEGGKSAPDARVVCCDARDIGELDLEPVDYCITSPPYWDMLRRRGYETQKERRESDELDIYYSDDESDLGNIGDYDEFLQKLVEIYRVVCDTLRDAAYLTVIVKNIKKSGTIYPLAWDLGKAIGEFMALKDEKIWCQDNQRLAPYGMGKAWVSNTMHHYCLNFRKD